MYLNLLGNHMFKRCVFRAESEQFLQKTNLFQAGKGENGKRPGDNPTFLLACTVITEGDFS